MALMTRSGPVDAGMHVAMQPSLFGTAPLACRTITAERTRLDNRSSVLFEPGWVEGSDQLFDQLRDELPWRAMERPMYDRIVAVPRLICTVEVEALGFDHPLALITRELESALRATFSSIGANYYRTGQDSVAWHRDSIGRTGVPATVALVSLGSPRTLAMRPASRSSPETSKTPETTGKTAATVTKTRRTWQLGHGDLFVMAGACQREWEHAVPKEAGVGPRISLAFRCKEAFEGPRIGRTGVPPLLASHKLQ